MVTLLWPSVHIIIHCNHLLHSRGAYIRYRKCVVYYGISESEANQLPKPVTPPLNPNTYTPRIKQVDDRMIGDILQYSVQFIHSVTARIFLYIR